MSTYSIPVINNRPPTLVDSSYYADILFDPDDSQPTYIGMHPTRGVSQDDLGWKIFKFTYSGTATTEIQLAYGAWSARALLF